jgi:Protein of unknown function (DUF2807).
MEETFSIIDFQNIFDTTIVPDTVNKIIITCGENLQPKVTANIQDGTLTLNHSEKYDWSREYKHIQIELHLNFSPTVYIHAPISLKTKGTIKGDNFTLIDFMKVSEVDVSVDVNSCGIYMSSDNFGYFKIKGRCNNADLWGWGSAIVRADSLLAKDCHIKHRGFNDVYVNVSGRLSVSLEYSGNVYYSGTPSEIIIENQLSSGRLIKLGQ